MFSSYWVSSPQKVQIQLPMIYIPADVIMGWQTELVLRRRLRKLLLVRMKAANHVTCSQPP